MSKKKICVVGGGSWGKNHIKTLNAMGNLGAIVEKNVDLINSYKESFPDLNFYDDLDDSFKKNYYGYVIATPAETHFNIAKKILENKKHLLVEKPLTLSIDHAKNLVELADRNNVKLMVGHVLLFHPAVRKIKDILDSGKIGELQYIYSNRLNLGKVRTEENVFWSFAPHDISIFQFLINSYPIKIDATGSSFLQKGIFDSTVTTLKYERGISCHIFVSWLHPFKEHRIVVIGSEGMISFEDSAVGKPLILYSKKINIKNGIPEKIDGPQKLIKYDKQMPLQAELEYFIKCDKPIISDGKNGLNVVKILVEASKKLDKKDE